MSQIKIQKRMKFVTVERPTAWLVVAFLVEFQDGVEVIVSEPKVVKVILKKKALELGSNSKMFALSGPVSCAKCASRLVASPYVAFFNTKETQNFSLFARPPTFA
jgi:hypothetical protein